MISLSFSSSFFYRFSFWLSLNDSASIKLDICSLIDCRMSFCKWGPNPSFSIYIFNPPNLIIIIFLTKILYFTWTYTFWKITYQRLKNAFKDLLKIFKAAKNIQNHFEGLWHLSQISKSQSQCQPDLIPFSLQISQYFQSLYSLTSTKGWA